MMKISLLTTIDKCYKLQSILIPRNVGFIDDYAFAFCHDLMNVDFETLPKF